MNLSEEIKPYIDGAGLIAPSRQTQPATSRGSDNGPCFTAEYLIMCSRLGIRQQYKTRNRLWSCVRDGILYRTTPRMEKPEPDQEGPDDYYAFAAFCREDEWKYYPRSILWSLFLGKGFLNNEVPGTPWRRDMKRVNWDAFLIRQPQLVAALIAAARLPWYLDIFATPLYAIAALVIATSCMNAPNSDTDARRLSWHLVQATSPASWLCKMASKLWYKRLYRDYPNGMKEVAERYYQPEHPFAEYWVD